MIIKTATFDVPTLGASYASGNAIGAEMFISDWPSSSPGALLHTVSVLDPDKQAPDMELVLSTAQLPITNNAAFAPSDDEAKSIVAIVPITGWSAYANNSVVTATSVGILIPTTVRYAYLISRGTPTFTTTGLKLSLMFLLQ